MTIQTGTPHRVIFMFIMATFFSGCSHWKSEFKKTVLFGSREIYTTELPNGLRLVLVEDHSSPTVAIQTWYQVGSRDESPGKTGLAHLFEHMMFKQTKKLKEGEFDRIMEALGAEGLNAFTSRDNTTYLVEVPRQRLKKILELEAERMENLVIDENSFKTELEVVRNERRQSVENSPMGLMDEYLYETTFTQSPYHWPVVGYQTDLESMSKEEALAFYRRFYHPSSAILIIAGDFKPAQALAWVHQYYDSLGQDRPKPIRLPPPQEAEPPRQKRKTYQLDIQTELLQLGTRIPGPTDADYPALEVASQILGGKKSSRLHQALVNSGIAGSVQIQPGQDFGETIWTAYVTLQEGKTANIAEKIILQEYVKLANEGPSERELQTAKNGLKFARFHQLAENDSFAKWIGTGLSIYGSIDRSIEEIQKVDAVTREQIKTVVRKYLTAQRTTTIVGMPKKKGAQ